MPNQVHVPALSLRPLIENAVKHGLSSRAAGGEIQMIAKSSRGFLEISIEDDGVGFQGSTARGSGTGLKNCQERLKLHYGDKSEFMIAERMGGGTRISMKLPSCYHPVLP